MSSSQNEAAERHRRRVRREGWIRRAVRLWRVGSILDGLAWRGAARAWLRERFGRSPDFKRLLATAPLEGIDIERSRDPGRKVDL